MNKALLESVLGENANAISETQAKTILESIENRAIDLASEKIGGVEKRYADQFSAMTESVSTTLVDMADDAFKNAANKAVKDDSVVYLMESVNKIRGILEDIGVVVGGPGDLQARMSKAEARYQKGLDLLKKAKSLVDENKDSINKLRVENFIRKSMTGMQQSIVEEAVVSFGGEDIDEIEDTLSQWLENADYTAPSSPTEQEISDGDIDEDDIEKDLEELDNMVSKSIFEAEGNPEIVQKPANRGALDNIRGLEKVTSPNGYMPDVSGAQLEALSNVDNASAMFESDDNELLASDVDVALKQIHGLGRQWQL